MFLNRETISPDDPQEKNFSHNAAISVRLGWRRCQDAVFGIWSIVHDVSGCAYCKIKSTDGKLSVTFFASDGYLLPNIFCGSKARRVRSFFRQSQRKFTSPDREVEVDAAMNNDVASSLRASKRAVFHPQPSSPTLGLDLNKNQDRERKNGLKWLTLS